MPARRRKSENEKEFKIRKEKEKQHSSRSCKSIHFLYLWQKGHMATVWCLSAHQSTHRPDEKGTAIPYNNGGGQSGIKDNPDVKTLIQYTRNITTITKQLVDLVPPSQKKSKLDELMNE